MDQKSGNLFAQAELVHFNPGSKMAPDQFSAYQQLSSNQDGQHTLKSMKLMPHEQAEVYKQLNSDPAGKEILKSLDIMPKSEIHKSIGTAEAFKNEKNNEHDFDGMKSNDELRSMSPANRDLMMQAVSNALHGELAANPQNPNDVMSIISKPQENSILQAYAKKTFIEENTEFLSRAYQIMQKQPPDTSAIAQLFQDRVVDIPGNVTINVKSKVSALCLDAMQSNDPVCLMRALYASVCEVKKSLTEDAFTRFLSDTKQKQALESVRS